LFCILTNAFIAAAVSSVPAMRSTRQEIMLAFPAATGGAAQGCVALAVAAADVLNHVQQGVPAPSEVTPSRAGGGRGGAEAAAAAAGGTPRDDLHA
jgi:hypothetical protein